MATLWWRISEHDPLSVRRPVDPGSSRKSDVGGTQLLFWAAFRGDNVKSGVAFPESMKAICLPSGDQTELIQSPGEFVKRTRFSLPSALMYRS